MPAVARLIRDEAHTSPRARPLRQRIRISSWAPLRPPTITTGRKRLGNSNWPLASPSAPAEAHWAYVPVCLSTFGRFEESAAEMRRTVEMDPLTRYLARRA